MCYDAICEYWETHVLKRDLIALVDTVRFCCLWKAFKKGTGKLMLRVKSPQLQAEETSEKDKKLAKTAKADIDKICQEGGHKLAEKLISLLTTLALVSERALADVTGSIFLCFIIPLDGLLAIALSQAGRAYHQTTKEKSPEEHGKGPPFLHIWYALISFLAEAEATAEACYDAICEYWEMHVLKRDLLALVDTVRF